MRQAIKQSTKSIFASLKIRNFRLYFFGQAVSLCGTWMQTIGQAWLVLQMTHSGTQLGLVAAAQFLPMLILGPVGGIIADRFNKRTILYFTQSASAALALILGLLIITHTVQLWMVYVLAALLGLINTADNPTRQSFIFEMVGPETLSNAISLNSAQVNLARVIGPAIGGGIIAAFGLAPCFILNAVSFLAVLGAIYAMRGEDLRPAPQTEKMKGRISEGWRYIKSNKLLRGTLLIMAIIGTLTYEFSVIMPLVAQTTFHGNAGTYAALSSFMGLGSLGGALWTARRKKATPGMLVTAALFFGIAVLLEAISPNFTFALFAIVLVGIFSINFLSLGNTILQLESEPQMRGRVMSFWAMAFLGSTPVGGPIIGWVGEHFSPRWGLGVGGIAALIAAGIGAVVLLNKTLPFTSTNDEAAA